MSSLRRTPFAVAAAVWAVVCLAIARLAEAFVAQLDRSSALDDSQGDWAYRLLVVIAIGQAAYGGFVLLRAERAVEARQRDPNLTHTSNEDLARMLARTAAVMPLLTIVYGLAAFFLTGDRGGFWLFALLALLQGAWYYRQVGMAARWLGIQQQPKPAPANDWKRESDDYCPPLARGMQTVRN